MIVNTLPTKKKKKFWNITISGQTVFAWFIICKWKETSSWFKGRILKIFSEFVHLYCHHWEISRERCSHQPGGTTAKGAPSPCPQTAGQVATSLFHRKRGFHPLTQALQRGSYKPAAAITVTTHNLPRSRNGITSYFPNSRNKKWNVYYNTASFKELNAVKKFKYH